MKLKSLAKALVAVSLMTSPALAQTDMEESSGPGWAAYLVLAGVAVGWILLILDDEDSDDIPASP